MTAEGQRTQTCYTSKNTEASVPEEQARGLVYPPSTPEPSHLSPRPGNTRARHRAKQW